MLIGTLATGQVKIGGTAKVGGTVKTTVQTGGAPTDFVNDTFTDTESVTLSSHTGEVGASWTQHPNYTTAIISIRSNRAHKDTATGSAAYYASGTPANADYTVECEMPDLISMGISSGCCGRASTTVDTMVCARRQNATTLQLIKFVSPSNLSLDTEAVTFNLDQIRNFKLIFTGTTVAWTVDGVSLGTGFDVSDVTDAGRCALRMTGQWDTAGGGPYPVNFIKCYQ